VDGIPELTAARLPPLLQNSGLIMDFEHIANIVKAGWPDSEAPKVDSGDPFIIVATDDARDVLKFLKDDADMAFDSLMCLSGADTGRELWVVYHLHSFTYMHKTTVKVVLPRENPVCDTVSDMWLMANFFEREVYDLYGVHFKGHPDLRRIMNPPDWVGWPGRKDYEYPAEYHGVPTLREDQFFSDAVESGNTEREEKEKEMLEKLGLVEKK
jgi:NADH-quinone oxidoreductase subunit C